MNMKRIEEAIARYTESATEDERARYAFFKGLWDIQNEEAQRLAAAYPYVAEDVDALEKHYWAGEPALQCTPVSINTDEYVAVCARIAKHLAQYEGVEPKAAETLAAYNWDKVGEVANLTLAQGNPTAFLEDCWENYNQFGVNGACSLHYFMMVLTFALRPFLQPASMQIMGALEKVVQLNKEYHNKPLRCPVCGSAGDASYVGGGMALEAHGRKLYCATCGAVWDFERIRCACCGERNQEQLHWFHVEEDPAHRIHVCDDCGGYMRTVFQDDLHAAVCMEVEDVAMAFLDEVAQKSGILPQINS